MDFSLDMWLWAHAAVRMHLLNIPSVQPASTEGDTKADTVRVLVPLMGFLSLGSTEGPEELRLAVEPEGDLVVSAVRYLLRYSIT